MRTISTVPDDMKELVRPELEQFFLRVKEAESKRSLVLGDSIRILGERTKKNAKVELPVNMRIRNNISVDRIDFNVKYPQNALLNPTLSKGRDIEMIPFVAAQPNDIISINLSWPPGNPRQFGPAEYEIAKLAFDIPQGSQSGFVQIQINNVAIYCNNALHGNRGMSGALFIED